MALVSLPRQILVDVNGTPRVGAKMYVYAAGTTDPITAYTTAAYAVAHPSPIVSVSSGLFPAVYVDESENTTYKLVVKDSSDVTIYTEDNIPAGLQLYPVTEAEDDSSVVPVNLAYPEGYVDRYGTNTTPGTTDMTAAIQAALNVAHAKGTGGNVYFLPATYRTTDAVAVDLNSVRIHIHGNGAVMQCDHNGNGIDWIVENENYSGHTIEKLTINGPNTFLPDSGYVPPSTGVGINMNRNATTNIVTAYNNTLRDVVIQGFLYGLDMQAVIGLNVFGCYIQYNQYGVRIAGGQTNANHFFGTHIRYNRKRGITSDGTTGGSLSNATTNTFKDCLIESNIPYPFVSGGTAPDDSTAIYLNNSYGFLFDGCYIENHSASIYLTGGSKFNQFLRCDLYPGGSNSRLSTIYLDGAGIYSNVFDVSFHATAGTDLHVVANSSDQLYNRFSGSGINFIAASIIAPLDYGDVKPDLNYAPSYGVGLIRMPSQGYQANVSQGTNPGQIDTLGGSGRTLNMAGVGQLQISNGLTSNTSVSTISGLLPHSFFTILNYQDSFTFTLVSGSGTGNIVLRDQRSIEMNKFGQQITFYVNGQGKACEVGRNFSTRKVGTASISGGNTTAAVTFAGAGLFDEPDTAYRVQFWVESVTGTPAAGSWNAYASSLATSGFTLNVQTAPGVGNTVNYGFEVIKLNS
jgi:hypothetical protein